MDEAYFNSILNCPVDKFVMQWAFTSRMTKWNKKLVPNCGIIATGYNRCNVEEKIRLPSSGQSELSSGE